MTYNCTVNATNAYGFDAGSTSTAVNVTLNPGGTSVALTALASFNRYAYGNNNPLRFIDPTGNSALPIFDWKDLAVDVGGLWITSCMRCPKSMAMRRWHN